MFQGLKEEIDETWKDSEAKIRTYISDDLGLDEEEEWRFYVPSSVFQSFRDDGKVNMKGSVQWSAV